MIGSVGFAQMGLQEPHVQRPLLVVKNEDVEIGAEGGIVSEWVAQVIDGLGNPLVISGDP